jgi:hypothetical protein
MKLHCRILVAAVTGAVALGAAGNLRADEVLIRGARVHTMSERGTLDRADVLVRDGRIAAVGSSLVAGAGATVVDAQGRSLTPGLFGGITALGIEEVEQEPSTVDRSTVYGGGEHGGGFEPRPEFDVTVAYNPDSVVIGVNRVEGITFAMVAPTALPDGTMFAGQGALARLDDRPDPFVAGSRTLFVDLGANATASSGKSRAAQFMLLDQATREARPGAPPRDGDRTRGTGPLPGWRPDRVQRRARRGYPAGARLVRAQRRSTRDRWRRAGMAGRTAAGEIARARRARSAGGPAGHV